MEQNQYLQYNQTNTFAAASMFCGTLSILTCCTGVLTIPAGALGIIFAILSKRLNAPMHPASKAGIRLSCIGIVLGIITLSYTIYMIQTDPEYQKLYFEILQQYSQYY